MDVVDISPISKVQPMREGEINAVDVINLILAAFPLETNDIADLAITTAKLSADIKDQLDFLQTVPSMEFGTSNNIAVTGSSYTEVTATFTADKTAVPIVFCGIQNATGNLACVVTQVTNLQFVARIYNLSTTDVENVTVDWLAISGR